MEKIFKKSLALLVSAALCLTAFVGCLTVNAETTVYNGTITATAEEIETTAETAVVTLDIASPDVRMNTAGIRVTTTFGKLISVETPEPEENNDYYIADPEELGKESTTINLDNGSFLIQAYSNGYGEHDGFGTAQAILTFAKDENVTLEAGATFPITITYLGDVSAATWNEDIVNLVPAAEYAITVKSTAPHEHVFGEYQTSETEHWRVCDCGAEERAVHVWNAGEVTKDPTEEETGIKTYTCTACKYVKEEVIEKLPHTHNYGEAWVSDETNHWHQCACGDKADVAAHDWGAGEITKEPTATEPGIRTFTCVCGKTKTEDIPATGPTEPVYDENLKFGGINGSFDSSYSLIFYVAQSVYNAYDTVYISGELQKFNKNTEIEPRVISLGEENYRVNEDGTPKLFTSGGVKYYQYELTGIAAKEVASDIVVTLYATKDGVEYYGQTRNQNLVWYANNFINKDTNFGRAMVAFLNYAAAAQERFGYNTSNLANASLTEAQKVVTLSADLVNDRTPIPDGYDGDVTVYGFNVAYEAQVEMVAYLKYKDGFDFTGTKMKFTYTNTSNTVVTDYIDLADITEHYSSDILTVRYAGIPAKDMRAVVSMVVLDAEGNEISNNRDFSLTSYAYLIQGKTDGPVSKAMIAFGDLMKVYKTN